MSSYGERMKQLMDERGISTEQLAARVGISQRAINMIISGETTRTRKSPEIAKALGTTHEYLMYGTHQKETSDATWIDELKALNLGKEQIDSLLNVAKMMSKVIK
ncbi:helix-turn-helix domain-containing protein [Vibrio parahaemolyticus]|nr:helix-turn-helix transcriptional regulator [Vibrio parahaemolyticus]